MGREPEVIAAAEVGELPTAMEDVGVVGLLERFSELRSTAGSDAWRASSLCVHRMIRSRRTLDSARRRPFSGVSFKVRDEVACLEGRVTSQISGCYKKKLTDIRVSESYWVGSKSTGCVCSTIGWPTAESIAKSAPGKQKILNIRPHGRGFISPFLS